MLTDVPAFLTPPEAAELLRVKATRIRRWIETGELVAPNLGDKSKPRYRIARAELLAFLDRRSVVHPPQKPRRRRRAQEKLPTRY